MERKILQEFIEVYRSEQALWKVKSTYYNNRAVKNAGYQRLLNKLLELYPDADLDTVKKKINALRTNFRKEQRKVEASRERGEQPVYAPSLWYYDLFSFVAEQDQPEERQQLQQEQQPEEEEELEDDEEPPVDIRDMLSVSLDENVYYEGDDLDDDEHSEEEYQPSSGPESPKPVENGQSSRASMESRGIKRKRDTEFGSWCSTQDSPTDENAIFGRYVASRVQKMDGPMQTLAERLISEVLYLGQMGQLSDHFAITRSARDAGH